MNSQERKKLIEDTINFIMSHNEYIDGTGDPFTIVDVDPETWWSKMQLYPHNPKKLLPKSRAHFEYRLSRWQELALEELL